jgi:peptidoglycan/xylan/chitin deacetylase (PgdA/CDA1 family)
MASAIPSLDPQTYDAGSNGMTHAAPTAPSWVALVYHDVLPATTASGGGPERFAVPVAAFETMLDTMLEGGFLGCSLDEAMRARGCARIAITFDDATSSQFDHAMPALRARGMTATVYVVRDWVGRPHYMTWDQLRRIRDWGMSVQSHTRSHPFLSELGAVELRDELERSKEALDRELAQETTEIAFPGGDPPARRLRHLIAATGYRVAVGTRWGVNADTPDLSHFIRRCTVRGDITADRARRYLAADPWLSLTMTPRETALRTIRSTLGASRYARWRRRILDLLSGRRGRVA